VSQYRVKRVSVSIAPLEEPDSPLPPWLNQDPLPSNPTELFTPAR